MDDIYIPDEILLMILTNVPECKYIMKISNTNERFKSLIIANIDTIIKDLFEYYKNTVSKKNLIIANLLNFCLNQSLDKFMVFTKICNFIENINFQEFQNDLIELKKRLSIQIKENNASYIASIYNYYWGRINNIDKMHVAYFVINNMTNEKIKKIQYLVKNGFNFKHACYAVNSNLNDEKIRMMNHILKMCPTFNVNTQLENASNLNNFMYFMEYEPFYHNIGNSFIDIIKIITTQEQMDKVIKYYKEGFNIYSITKIINHSDETIEMMYTLINSGINKARASDIVSLSDENFKIVMEFINEHNICGVKLDYLFNYSNEIIPHVKKIFSHGINFQTSVSMVVNGHFQDNIIQQVVQLMNEGQSCHNAYYSIQHL
jgi:hypothetical protein